MNWDNQLSSILSAADDSVAKMRERLTSPGTFSTELFPVRDGRPDPGLDPVALPPLPTRAPMLQQPSSSLTPPAVQWADLAAIQTQLQVQSQALEALTKKVQSVERERDSQQRRVRLLEEEICRLREESQERERERARDDTRRGQSPGTERMMEQWRRDIGRELSTLRGHITRATSLSNLEESFSSKLRGEELQHLQREVDHLKARLRGQEEDMLVQQSEVRETRRQYERSCKKLEQITDTNRTHGLDLAKTVTQHTRTQQEVRQIRVSVSDLRDEVSRLMLREEPSTPAARPPHQSASSAPGSQRRSGHGPEPGGEQPDSEDSEDFSPTPSLAEVSSDDLSWLDDHEPAPLQKRVPRVRLRTRSTRGDVAGPGSDLGGDDDDDGDEDLDDDDDDDDDDVHLGLGSDLSLDDL